MKRIDWTKQYGPKLVPDFGAKTTRLPKGIIGIRAPRNIDEAPGGFILFSDREEPVKKYGYVVANFSYYGQTVYNSERR